MINGKKPRVFISYAAAESSVASALSKTLNELGIQAWSPDRLETNQRAARMLEQALQSASWYIVLISEDALLSPYVNFEIGAALGSHKKLLPVFLTKRAKRKALALLKRRRGILAEGLSPKDIADKVAQAIEKEAA
jgi:TIR domain-containing protein